ncbi:hypothetical protein SAMN05421578_105354 [Paenibacillus macquariensis]|uniref:Uncharacterized protein n=1 Tax=Paenibacillus macquariensis TaxID=948756 RepID=A0ABY1JYG7_9BACL|nr:hypothetical protein SAMN05421578_105354 [Paenibacillus macquariensis]
MGALSLNLCAKIPNHIFVGYRTSIRPCYTITSICGDVVATTLGEAQEPAPAELIVRQVNAMIPSRFSIFQY